MKTPTSSSLSEDDYRTLSADDLVALLNEKDQRLAAVQDQLSESKNNISDKERYIRILEECLRLANAKQYGASSEKLDFQVDLFDQAGLEVALAEFEDQLSEEDLIAPPAKQARRRGFSENLNRVRVELSLRDEEKARAQSTFFRRDQHVDMTAFSFLF
ncbi:transposase [Halioxenophilus aromaticivorans]|uniref:Transposase TnpC homeodomain domain-containing protein n=1 Tax=Halioxenophilus aromaticivorans TaxID=1306992 RepID=A0AAV3TZP1_9ALTE